MTTVDCITGFLGAGKTTFILRYAAWLKSRGLSVAVIENEFGMVGCDGAVLKDTGLTVSELSGGCICCSLKVDFAQALVSLSDAFDHILVEPSGIFTPADFVEVMHSPSVRAVCKTGCIAAVLDPTAPKDLPGDATDVLSAQINAADVLILSRTDNLADNECDAAARLLRELSPAAKKPVLTKPWPLWTDADFFALLLDSKKPRLPATRPFAINHATIFNSATLSPKRVFAPDALRIRLARILSDPACGEVLRIKGAVTGADGTMLSINITASGMTITPLAGAVANAVNIIGRRIARKRILAILEEPDDES